MPQECGCDRVVVGRVGVASAEVYGLQCAAVEYVVDMEIEPVGVEGYYRSVASKGIGVVDILAREFAYGIAVGHIVEVAGYDYVADIERVDQMTDFLGLIGMRHKCLAQFGYEYFAGG